MATETSTAGPQQGSLQKKLFNNHEFAARYKSGEPIPGAFGQELLLQLGLANQKDPINLLDLASGTGIMPKLAIEILNKARSASQLLEEDRITCFDLASMMLEILRSRIEPEAWPVSREQIEIKEGDMRDTKLPSDAYTHVTCNFGPVIDSHPEKVLHESYRVVKPGGIAGWTIWCEVGWHKDVKQAIVDIRNAASLKCKDGTAVEDDQKLSKLPDLGPPDEIVLKLADIDLRQMREDGVREEDLPRWDQVEFLRSHIEKAGFRDVKVSQMQKMFQVDLDTSLQSTRPVAGILANLWTQDQREELAGVDLTKKLQEWYVKRFQESDVQDGKITWGVSEALVASGRKPS